MSDRMDERPAHDIGHVDPSVVSALYDARARGKALVLEAPLKLDRHQGLALQLEVLSRFRDAGEKLGGWKIGLTSGPGRDAMGKGFRPFGFILETR